MMDFQKLKEQLDLPISALQFTAFDFETTGLYPDKDRIIEIGAVKFTLQEEGTRFSTLIDPSIPVPPAATKINGITDDMLRGKPKIHEVLPHFSSFIGDSVLVAHNASFDMGFLRFWLSSCNLKPIENHAIDTVEFAKQTVSGMKKYSLSYLCSVLELPVSSSHRALDDAQACRELFLYCSSLLPDKDTRTLKQLYI